MKQQFLQRLNNLTQFANTLWIMDSAALWITLRCRRELPTRLGQVKNLPTLSITSTTKNDLVVTVLVYRLKLDFYMSELLPLGKIFI